MGLLNRPQVLFLDEPTTGLDPEARALMWRYIDELAREEQMTIWITTHYMDEADSLAAQLAIVDRGRIVAQGSPDELKRQLDGDSLMVELAQDDEPAARAARSPASRAFTTSSSTAADCGRGRSTAAPSCPRVLAALEAQNVSIASVKVSRPSLDDVYLRFAGRAFEQAEDESKGERQ